MVGRWKSMHLVGRQVELHLVTKFSSRSGTTIFHDRVKAELRDRLRRAPAGGSYSMNYVVVLWLKIVHDRDCNKILTC